MYSSAVREAGAPKLPLLHEEELSDGDSVPMPLGFIALAPEWHLLKSTRGIEVRNPFSASYGLTSTDVPGIRTRSGFPLSSLTDSQSGALLSLAPFDTR